LDGALWDMLAFERVGVAGDLPLLGSTRIRVERVSVADTETRETYLEFQIRLPAKRMLRISLDDHHQILGPDPKRPVFIVPRLYSTDQPACSEVSLRGVPLLITRPSRMPTSVREDGLPM
jgi:hypothetical protein